MLFTLTLPVAAFAPYFAEILWVLVFPLGRLAYVWYLAEERKEHA